MNDKTKNKKSENVYLFDDVTLETNSFGIRIFLDDEDVFRFSFRIFRLPVESRQQLGSGFGSGRDEKLDRVSEDETHKKSEILKSFYFLFRN